MPKILLLILFITLFTTAISCAPEKYLRTEEVKTDDITGTYTLILYGGRYLDDIETVAILDKEGDRYNFEIYAPEFDYKIKKGTDAKDALKEAEKFVSFHRAFHQSILSRISDKMGETIGYELRPLYYPINYGFSDVLDVDYIIKDSRVIVKIRLRPEVESLFNEDKPFIFQDIHGPR